METPIQKANILVDKFLIESPDVNLRLAKQCALITVSEIIELAQSGLGTQNDWDFWNSVKDEINNL